jgi:hypothetical protein
MFATNYKLYAKQLLASEGACVMVGEHPFWNSQGLQELDLQCGRVMSWDRGVMVEHVGMFGPLAMVLASEQRR